MKNESLINELSEQIEKLKQLSSKDSFDFSQEIAQLSEKLDQVKKDRKSSFSDWERVSLARHPNRPTASDYIEAIMDDFLELHGDRMKGDDKALIGGLAKFEGQTVIVIAQEKGGDAEESKSCNFGMVHPRGYRKAIRLIDLAHKFSFPIISLIDTPGAYPGKSAEEGNIGGAIANCIYKMIGAKVPVIATIIGEGGSGGAVAIGAGDKILMLENSIYSVISPEGCAAILWNEREKAETAASNLKLTAKHLIEYGLIDKIIEEGPEGAHKDFDTAAQNLRQCLHEHLNNLKSKDCDRLVDDRKEKYLSIGKFKYAERKSPDTKND